MDKAEAYCNKLLSDGFVPLSQPIERAVTDTPGAQRQQHGSLTSGAAPLPAHSAMRSRVRTSRVRTSYYIQHLRFLVLNLQAEIMLYKGQYTDGILKLVEALRVRKEHEMVPLFMSQVR